MTEILFGAKRIDNGEWVQGYVVKHGNRWWIYTGKVEYIYYPIFADKPERFEIDEETIEVLSTEVASKNGDEWIPVGDRLPEEHEEYNDVVDPLTLAVVDTELHKVSELVLVTVYDSNKDKTFVTDDCTVDGKWANYDDWFDVLAWKPLPPTYEPEVE